MDEPRKRSGWAEKGRRFGFSETLIAFVLAPLRRYLGIEFWSVQTRPLKAHFQMPAEHARRFGFRPLSLEDALAATSDPELQMSQDFVEQAFARGDICVGAYDGDRLIAYTWRSFSGAPVKGKLCMKVLDARCRYGYKSLVLPEYRGERLNTSVGRFYDRHFVEQGIVYDLGFVSLDNLPSMKSTFRDPERSRIGYAAVINWSGRFWTFRSRNLRSYLAFEVMS